MKILFSLILILFISCGDIDKQTEITKKLVECDSSSTPSNATPLIELVEVELIDGIWSEPDSCYWYCNNGYHNEDVEFGNVYHGNGTCLSNTKITKCEWENFTQANVTDVESNWVNHKWVTPKCDWDECDFMSVKLDDGTCHPHCNYPEFDFESETDCWCGDMEDKIAVQHRVRHYVCTEK